MITACFLFLGELNDFLPSGLRRCVFPHACAPDASIKHTIEALGVPHTEVGLILVEAHAVDFRYRLDDGVQVRVHPAQYGMIQGPPLRPPLPLPARFVADAHLGQLARQLRMLGFDVLYRNDYGDAEIARIASGQQRIVLTRDRDLLIRKEIEHARYLHALNAERQTVEVMRRFGLTHAIRAFSRCLQCNGLLRDAERPVLTATPLPWQGCRQPARYTQCEDCHQLYWQGTHVDHMRLRVARMLNAPELVDAGPAPD